jgi:hypothetical protein
MTTPNSHQVVEFRLEVLWKPSGDCLQCVPSLSTVAWQLIPLEHQQFLPLALHGLLTIEPWMVVMRIFKIFRWICNKVWNLVEIDSLWVNVAINLASVQIHFPISFFNIMIHLLYHLVDELDLCGPVATRWMYLMEWYMKTLKTYMRNMARPKGSMAEGCIWNEFLSFIMKYLQKIWGCAMTHMGCWRGKRRCWWSFGRCWAKIHVDSSFMWPYPPICNNQHYPDVTLAQINKINYYLEIVDN